MDTSQALRQADAHHRGGRLLEAERLYKIVAAAEPDGFAAWHRLSIIKYQQGHLSEALHLVGEALARDAGSAAALSNQGLILHALERYEEALASYERALLTVPGDLDVHVNRANALLASGRCQEALESYDRILEDQQDDADVHFNRANALVHLKRFDEARTGYSRALVLKPDLAADLCRRGAGFHRQGRLAEAMTCFEEVLRTNPRDINANHLSGVVKAQQGDLQGSLNRIATAAALAPNVGIIQMNHGNALHALGRIREALEKFDTAIALMPDSFDAYYNRGNVLIELKRPEDALASYDKATLLKQDHVGSHNNRGNALQDLNRNEEALASYEAAIRLKPDDAEAHNNRGNALRDLKRYEEALASYNRALAINSGYADAYNNRGNTLKELARLDEALMSYDTAIALKPEHVVAQYNRAVALKDLKRFDEALASFRRILSLKPDHFNALAQYVYTASCMCDWSAVQHAKQNLIASSELAQFDGPSFPFLSISDDPSVQQRAAHGFVKNNARRFSAPSYPHKVGERSKVHLGYLSADFRNHATAFLIAELIELHDRSRFKVYGFSAGADDNSGMRKRLRNAFDVFTDVGRMSDEDLRKTLRQAEVDILIDLGGHTADSRMLALAGRPAPIQVSYLGYPATTGAPFIDYTIVDAFVAPHDATQYFTEKLVYLPDCYQVNDRKRQVSAQTPSRAECGLPDGAFVFCCFNNAHKIGPPMFEIWTRLLKAIPHAVFWLVGESSLVQASLRREAQARGVDPTRLVFAPQTNYPDHLSRQRLADLFLDTWPYNAGTTASDALWIGLPVVTYSGRAFAARMAGSILNAIGLSELVTNSLDDYESLAISLARDPARLAALRERLEANRRTRPLFDTDRFRRHLEAAYQEMWRLHKNGESPRSFTVPPFRV